EILFAAIVDTVVRSVEERFVFDDPPAGRSSKYGNIGLDFLGIEKLPRARSRIPVLEIRISVECVITPLSDKIEVTGSGEFGGVVYRPDLHFLRILHVMDLIDGPLRHSAVHTLLDLPVSKATNCEVVTAANCRRDTRFGVQHGGRIKAVDPAERR